MDRAIVYSGALPQTTDILNTNKMGQVGLGYALRGILGGNTVVHNLACTPTSPASLQVTIGVGAIYTLDTLDASAYSDLGLDQHQIIKQGLLQDSILLTVTPPVTSGQSQVYLVEAILSDIDTGSAVLPYYNATNPSAPFSGPGNNGMSQYTTRSVACTIALKAGTPAPTGSQATPAPDAGYTGLYAITVVNGQTAITSGNIVLQPTAPFFPTLPAVPNDVQTSAWTYAVDTGAVNAMVATLYPPITSLVPGTAVLVRAAFGNTGTASLNVNGTGAQPVHRANGSNVVSGDYNAGEILALVWDGAAWQIINFFGFTATTTNNNTFVLSIPFAVDSGSINAMTALFSPALTSLVAGEMVEVQVSNTNTGDSTLICNALAAKFLRQNGSALQPRALVAGQIITLIYDGTVFQVVNARWPYYSFDTSAPPGSDQFMAVGDKFNITFTNATLVPLKVAAVQGLYRVNVCVANTVVSGLDNDPFLLPNNTTYLNGPDTFWNWVIMNSGDFGAAASSPFMRGYPASEWWNDSGISIGDSGPSSGFVYPEVWSGAFGTDLYQDGGPTQSSIYTTLGNKQLNVGPIIGSFLCCTFTNAKQVHWSLAGSGGPIIGYSRWWDTTTVWNSLGTFLLGGNGAIATPISITGTLVVERLA